MSATLSSLPPWQGARIGLFGGSFNPPHAGHSALAGEAIKRLGLERVWWLVAPQNPLKSPAETARYEQRLAAARALNRSPRVAIVDIEARAGTQTTAQTLAVLAPVLRRGQFVWLMGADSFAGLHLWHDWRRLPQTLPLAVFDRPGWGLKALSAPAARAFASFRVPACRARELARLEAPAWSFLTWRLNRESSTQHRRCGDFA